MSGRIETVTLETFIGQIPTIRGLQIQPSGITFDLDAEKQVKISHPSIGFYSCGQSEVVYYWVGSGFKQIVVSR